MRKQFGGGRIWGVALCQSSDFTKLRVGRRNSGERDVHFGPGCWGTE